MSGSAWVSDILLVKALELSDFFTDTRCIPLDNFGVLGDRSLAEGFGACPRLVV